MAGKAKVFSGARAKIYVDDVLVGIFDSCTYSVNIGAEPIFTLGKHGAHEILNTSYEPVTANCSGFRVIGHGAHVLPKFPTLGQLLNLESVKLDIVDRQADQDALPVFTLHNCIPVNFSSGPSAKASTRIQITYLGTHATDETGDQSEAGAVELIPAKQE